MQFDFSDIKKVDRAAFYESGLKEVCLPENIEVVSEWAFFECKNIKEIFISDKVKNIEVSAFASSPNAEISFI